jgi:hypothetical protein
MIFARNAASAALGDGAAVGAAAGVASAARTGAGSASNANASASSKEERRRIMRSPFAFVSAVSSSPGRSKSR